MVSVSFHRLARRELIEAAEFYDLANPGLGRAFLDEVERSTQSILDYPDASPILIGSVRRRLLARFPYAVLYSAKHDKVRILAMMNLKRRPLYWAGRV